MEEVKLTVIDPAALPEFEWIGPADLPTGFVVRKTMTREQAVEMYGEPDKRAKAPLSTSS